MCKYTYMVYPCIHMHIFTWPDQSDFFHLKFDIFFRCWNSSSVEFTLPGNDHIYQQGTFESMIFRLKPVWWDMGVSKNDGTPKSSILIGFFIINHPFWGASPYFWVDTHMLASSLEGNGHHDPCVADVVTARCGQMARPAIRRVSLVRSDVVNAQFETMKRWRSACIPWGSGPLEGLRWYKITHQKISSLSKQSGKRNKTLSDPGSVTVFPLPFFDDYDSGNSEGLMKISSCARDASWRGARYAEFYSSATLGCWGGDGWWKSELLPFLLLLPPKKQHK